MVARNKEAYNRESAIVVSPVQGNRSDSFRKGKFELRLQTTKAPSMLVDGKPAFTSKSPFVRLSLLLFCSVLQSSPCKATVSPPSRRHPLQRENAIVS